MLEKFRHAAVWASLCLWLCIIFLRVSADKSGSGACNVNKPRVTELFNQLPPLRVRETDPKAKFQFDAQLQVSIQDSDIELSCNDAGALNQIQVRKALTLTMEGASLTGKCRSLSFGSIDVYEKKTKFKSSVSLEGVIFQLRHPTNPHISDTFVNATKGSSSEYPPNAINFPFSRLEDAFADAVLARFRAARFPCPLCYREIFTLCPDEKQNSYLQTMNDFFKQSSKLSFGTLPAQATFSSSGFTFSSDNLIIMCGAKGLDFMMYRGGQTDSIWQATFDGFLAFSKDESSIKFAASEKAENAKRFVVRLQPRFQVVRDSDFSVDVPALEAVAFDASKGDILPEKPEQSSRIKECFLRNFRAGVSTNIEAAMTRFNEGPKGYLAQPHYGFDKICVDA